MNVRELCVRCGCPEIAETSLKWHECSELERRSFTDTYLSARKSVAVVGVHVGSCVQVEYLCSKSKQWVPWQSFPFRCCFPRITIADQRIFLAGGRDPENLASPVDEVHQSFHFINRMTFCLASTQLFCYDLKTTYLSHLPSMRTGRATHSVTFSDGFIYVAGGIDDTDRPTKTAER